MECPFCGGEIPKEKIEEFDSKFNAQESKIKEELEQDFKKELKTQKQNDEEKLSQQKELFENFKETLRKNYEGEIEKTRKDFEKISEERIKTKENEIQTISNKLKDAEAERDKIEKKAEDKYKKKIDELAGKIKENEEKEEENNNRVNGLREAIKEKDDKIHKINEKNLEQTEKLKAEYEEKLRKLENKTPSELGEEGQTEVLDILNRTFQRDDITETKHGKTGSDIFHKIMYNGEGVGLIIYEVKNVGNWNNDFIDQTKQDKTKHGANYALLVSNIFPAKEKTICEKEGILIVHPTKVAIIAREIRNFLIEAHKAKLTGEEIEEKIKILQEYFTSPEYKNMVLDLANAIRECYELREKEKSSHERHWAEEEKLNNRISQRAAKIHAKIASIIESKVERAPITITIPQTKKKKKLRKNQ